MARVLKMMHNVARDEGTMVSIYRHASIDDCIAQFDRDFANRHKQHTTTDEYETKKLSDNVRIDMYGMYCSIDIGEDKCHIRWMDVDCLVGEPKDCMAWNE